MPLDKIRGEQIGDLGYNFRVVPNSKWRETVFFNEAAQHASKVFYDAGALVPIGFDEDDVLVQEYPKACKLAFVFCKTCRGKDHYYPFVFDLGPDLVGELISNGYWDRQEFH